ncbi:hypothetical protein M0R88_10325 [Halorussus gelatinilyticus]|uniref:Uncharacterized protein n=1 Tax=Halorussus gelatinilyticus TaxID=2937524 RepID=A0A8U0ID01_9EURY|nr:hypothetical protein [Halorussus gelatinilyticus]UPV98926.1 hypothetical protein M0R88_10325 [Halorussus gelatinilyticus]
MYLLHSVRDTASLSDTHDVSDHVTICWDCFEWQPVEKVEQKIRNVEQRRNAEPGLSTLYARALFRTLVEKVRLFSYAGRVLFVRRLTIVFSVALLFLVVTTLLATLVGTLFVSVQTGFRWSTSVLRLLQGVGTILVANPWLIVGGLATGYFGHVTERERDYLRGVQRERRRGGGRDLPSYDGTNRPRWHLLAGFVILALLGTLDWVFLSLGFRDGSPVGAAVLWLCGSVGVAYALRRALYEDRDAGGFPVRPTPWVFASRTALAFGLLELTVMLVGRPGLLPLPRPLTQAGFILVPLVGGLYVLRRTVERRWGWRLRLPISLLPSPTVSTRDRQRRASGNDSPTEQQTDNDLEQ